MTQYLQAIKDAYPRLKIKTAFPAEGGQNNDMVVVNDTIMFRFPRYRLTLQHLPAEVAVLDALADKLPIPIPKITYRNLDASLGEAFIGYERLIGYQLERDTFARLSNAQRNTIAQQLAEFLQALHAVEIDGGVPIVDRKADWEVVFKRVKNILYPYMRADARAWADMHFGEFLENDANFDRDPALKHGDFGADNILFDGEKITGIVDFGGAFLGDPAFDYASLLSSYDEPFIKMVGAHAPMVDETWERITFYRGAFALMEALFGVENADREAFEAGIKPYQ